MKHLQFCFLLFMFGYLGLLTQGMLVCSDFPSGKSELRVEFHKKNQKTNKKNQNKTKISNYELITTYLGTHQRATLVGRQHAIKLESTQQLLKLMS